MNTDRSGGPSRRRFVLTSGSALGGAWVAMHVPAIRALAAEAREAAAAGAGFRSLTPREARDLDALAALIIPSDGTPGAREAGAVHFIDRALEGFAAWTEEPLREGLADLAARARARARTRAVGEAPRAPPRAGEARRPEAAVGDEADEISFADLPPADQEALLREVENESFFGLARTLVAMGTFCDPSYGGNRDEVGWKLLGFEDRPVWQPPFGWYDTRAGGAPGDEGRAPGDEGGAAGDEGEPGREGGR